MRAASFVLLGFLVFLLGLVPIGVAEDPKPPTPINVPVNTDGEEDEPHVADNGLTLYFMARRKGKEEFMVAHRRSVGQSWPPKSEVLGPYVSTAADDRGVFAIGGRYPQYLFFATKKDKESKNYDIYVAVKQDVGRVWTEPRAVTAIDTPADELHPWVTADGRALYFSRKTEDGWRVLVTTRAESTGPQGWGAPKPLTDLSAGFHHATLTPDGKTMYLQGPLEKGRWGLFVSQRTEKGWSKPEALDELNGDGKTGDRSPNLTRDGRFLYYASDRSGGKGGLDLWVVPAALKKR